MSNGDRNVIETKEMVCESIIALVDHRGEERKRSYTTNINLQAFGKEIVTTRNQGIRNLKIEMDVDAARSA